MNGWIFMGGFSWIMEKIETTIVCWDYRGTMENGK